MEIGYQSGDYYRQGWPNRVNTAVSWKFMSRNLLVKSSWFIVKWNATDMFNINTLINTFLLFKYILISSRVNDPIDVCARISLKYTEPWKEMMQEKAFRINEMIWFYIIYFNEEYTVNEVSSWCDNLIFF